MADTRTYGYTSMLPVNADAWRVYYIIYAPDVEPARVVGDSHYGDRGGNTLNGASTHRC